MTIEKKSQSKIVAGKEKELLNPTRKVVFLDSDKLDSQLKPYGDILSEKQISGAKKELRRAKDKAAAKTCHLGNDKSITFVAISKKFSAFNRQKFFKRKLPGSLKSDDGPILVDLTGVGRKLQLDILAELEILSNVSGWKPIKYTNKPIKNNDSNNGLSFKTGIDKSAAKKVIERAFVQAQGMNLIRTLSDMPGNKLTPGEYKKLIQKRSKQIGYKYSFMGQSQLEKKNAGAFLAVTQGLTKNDGGIAVLSQNTKPRSPKGKVNLVGKGICFDTGGYNLKGSQYMAGMQRDMGGSALALAIFETLVQTFPKLEFTAYLALAENIVSEKAYRPSDVVTASNGTTIEVVDTDAEGRMVLSDTLAIASSKKVDLTMTFATLTGAAVRSVGTQRSCVFTRNYELHPKFFKASQSSGEQVWPFPVGEEYFGGLKSQVADTLQCSTKPNADHIHAATFLSQFASDAGDWVHMDLSADGNVGGLGLTSSETTGFGILWSSSFIKEYFGNAQ